MFSKSNIVVWLVYAVGLVLMPAVARYDTTMAAWLTALYVALVCLPGILHSKSKATKTAHAMSARPLHIYLCFLIALIGLALHLYDKIVILGIDYSDGVGRAKGAWLNGRPPEAFVSSWASAFGHLLSHAAYPMLYLTLRNWEQLRLFPRSVGLVGSLAVLFVYSAAIGIRSELIVLMAFMASVMCLRRILSLSFFPRAGRWTALLWSVIVVVFVGYAMLVFSDRAGEAESSINVEAIESSAASGLDATNYFSTFYAEESSGFDEIQSWPSSLRRVGNYMVLAAVYIVHSHWTFAYVTSLAERPGTSVANMFWTFLIRAGVVDVASLGQRAFSGVMLSLPGCLFYDFGVSGLIIGALLLGLVGAWLERRVRQKGEMAAQIPLILCLVTSFVAPITSFANLMPMPFVCCALGLYWLLSLNANRAR